MVFLTAWGTYILSTSEYNQISQLDSQFKKAVFNQVQLKDVDSKSKIGQGKFKKLSEDIWSISWEGKSKVYLKDSTGIWWTYQKKKKIQGTVIIIH